jgi:hypothetical protein
MVLVYRGSLFARCTTLVRLARIRSELVSSSPIHHQKSYLTKDEAMTWRSQNNEPFTLISVEKSEPPEGNQGTDWVHYRIAQGPNEISGYRRGSLASARKAAKEIVANLNERRSPKRGRVQLTQSRKSAKAGNG